jgi:hypothetical protein
MAKNITKTEVVKPFEQWNTPEDISIEIQRLYHLLITDQISMRQATAAVGVLKVYLANMYLHGPAACGVQGALSEYTDETRAIQ